MKDFADLQSELNIGNLVWWFFNRPGGDGLETKGSQSADKVQETIAIPRPTIPCPNPRCHKGWVMVQNGPDDIDHDLCPICDGNMFVLKEE
jgi:hypothetical protein